jgi:hypothetical protein
MLIAAVILASARAEGVDDDVAEDGGDGGGDSDAPPEKTFEMHASLNAPLRIGLGDVNSARQQAFGNPLHLPVIPDDGFFSPQYTGLQGPPTANLALSYGDDRIRGTIGFMGQNFTDSSWTDDTTQIGIAQGYVTFVPVVPPQLRVDARIGAFSDGYGGAGEYDAGRYQTWLFGQTHLVGERVRVEVETPIDGLTAWAEQGLGGKQPMPSEYNNARFTLLHHEHGGLRIAQVVTLGGHAVNAWSEEGGITIGGFDVRVDHGRLGHLYLGGSRLHARRAQTVAGVIDVIHSFGGGEFDLGIVHNYLDGPDQRSRGTGTVWTALGQLDASLARLLLGRPRWTPGRDLTLSAWGMGNLVASNDPDMDGVTKLKYGTELGFVATSMFTFAARVDRVEPNSAIPSQSFLVLTPQFIVRSSWFSNEQISLSYSRYVYAQSECTPAEASSHCVQIPVPWGQERPTPDVDVFKLGVTMWW